METEIGNDGNDGNDGNVLENTNQEFELKRIRLLSSCDFNSILVTGPDTPTNIRYHTNAEKLLRVLEFFNSVNPEYVYFVGDKNSNVTRGTWLNPLDETNTDRVFEMADIENFQFLENDNPVNINIGDVDFLEVGLPPDQHTFPEFVPKEEPKKKRTRQKKSDTEEGEEKKKVKKKCIEIAMNSKKQCRSWAVEESDYCSMHSK